MIGTTIFGTRRVNRPSAHDVIRGMGTIVNVRGRTSREYDFARTEVEADCRALSDDWTAIGGDLEAAVTAYRRGRR